VKNKKSGVQPFLPTAKTTEMRGWQNRLTSEGEPTIEADFAATPLVYLLWCGNSAFEKPTSRKRYS